MYFEKRYERKKSTDLNKKHIKLPLGYVYLVAHKKA